MSWTHLGCCALAVLSTLASCSADQLNDRDRAELDRLINKLQQDESLYIEDEENESSRFEYEDSGET